MDLLDLLVLVPLLVLGVTLQLRDANGALVNLKVGSGDGSVGNPYAGVLTNVGDGTNQFLSSSAANMATFLGNNAMMLGFPGEWIVTSAPAVNTVASAVKAAGAAGVRHVCTSISFTLSQDSTGGTPFTGIINLRDGASGAGAVLGTWNIGCPTAACNHNSFQLSNLSVVGSAATAMTLEFTNVAPGAHTLESCTLTGYDVS